MPDILNPAAVIKFLNKIGLAEPSLLAVRLVRHKPLKRCLVEYDVLLRGQGEVSQAVTLVGKVRAKGLDWKTYKLCAELWKRGFSGDSRDGISVPEPLGVIPELNMWLYRKVEGEPSGKVLASKLGTALARRIAQAAHKIHTCAVPAQRRHSIREELEILHKRLSEVCDMHPKWQSRIKRLVKGCDRLGETMAGIKLVGIHRDFYPAQVLVNRKRIYIIDWDLYSLGDPALDIGNFLGHIKEESLRLRGNADSLIEVEEALEDEFLKLTDKSLHKRIRAYTFFTLARHIYISITFPERRPFTEGIIGLCEKYIKEDY